MLKGIRSQRFALISGDSGHRDKHFANSFIKIDKAVLNICSFLHLTMADYGGRHFL